MSDLDRAEGTRPLDEEEAADRGDRSLAEEFLDDLIPPELDWRRVVRRHPIPSLLVAAAAGYWLGRSRRGRVVVDALAGVVATGLVARVGELGDLADDDLLD